MNCPKCNASNALLLLTNVLCCKPSCENYNRDYCEELLAQEKDQPDLRKKKTWPRTRTSKYRRLTRTRMHRFKQLGTITGRFDSTKPNLSNLPKLSYYSDTQSLTKQTSKMYNHIMSKYDFNLSRPIYRDWLKKN